MTGSYEPGQMAMRFSGTMDSDQGVAVAALVEEGKLKLERGPHRALGHHPRIRREHLSEVGREAGGEPLRPVVWGIDEDEIVFTTLA